MAEIKIAIIEDETQIQQSINEILQNLSECQVVGIAGDVESALRLIQQNSPDLLLLDIQLGNKTAFDLLDILHLRANKVPEIIFITSFNNFAVEAFKAQAFDFLLKPLDKVELVRAINRYCQKKNQSNHLTRIENLLREFRKNSTILLPCLTGFKNIKASDIFYFQLSKDKNLQNISIYYSCSEREILPSSLKLKDLLNQLTEEDFFQINRTTVINKQYLSIVEIKLRQCIMIKGDSQINLTISRNRLKTLKSNSNNL